MRRLIVGIAITTLLAVPYTALAGDREIAEQIIAQLKTHRDTGALKDFKVDLKVNQGIVVFKGTIANEKQRELVLLSIKGIGDVANVVDEMSIKGKAPKPTVTLAKSPIAEVIAPESIKAPSKTKLASATEVVEKTAPPMPKPMPAKVERPKAVVIPTLKPEAKPVAAKPAPMPEDLDRRLNASITKALTEAKNDGRLRGFAMDITTNAGDVWLKGRTVTADQRDTVLSVVRAVSGVRNVADDIEVMIAKPLAKQEPVRQASEVVPMQSVPTPPANLAPVPVQSARQVSQIPTAKPAMVRRAPARLVPVPYRQNAMPRPYAPASVPVNGASMMGGQPMPMQMASAGGAYGAPRHDQPNLPNYAWPGYSAYPNYAALTYPKQYSPSAWPYIGPFYPYPQVPLNWRKVTLQWDDGWWFLDYSSKSR